MAIVYELRAGVFSRVDRPWRTGIYDGLAREAGFPRLYYRFAEPDAF